MYGRLSLAIPPASMSLRPMPQLPKVVKSPRPMPPRFTPHGRRRVREYLTPDETAAVIDAARHSGRNGARDGALLLLMYRHALRVSEAVGLLWSQIDFAGARLHVARLKHGLPSVHPLSGDEMRALRALHRAGSGSGFVFMSERAAPLSTVTVRKIVARAGELAGLAAIGLPVHPHMLRHACGYYLANKGHDTRAIQAYLGHRNITHTVRYTELSPERFKDFWRD